VLFRPIETAERCAEDPCQREIGSSETLAGDAAEFYACCNEAFRGLPNAACRAFSLKTLTLAAKKLNTL
jgi:hypothetical protein